MNPNIILLLNGLKNKLTPEAKDAITTVISIVVLLIAGVEFSSGLGVLSQFFAVLPETLLKDLLGLQVALVAVAQYISGGDAKPPTAR